MSRFVSSTNETESAQTSIRMAVMVDLDFSSGNLLVHDGVGTVTDSFASPTAEYLGVGQFGGIDGSVQDSLEVIARPIRLVLSGVDSALITSAMTEDYQGRAVVIYLGFIDTETNVLLDAPEAIWEGRMDYMEVDLGDSSSTIRINCEHRLRREPRIARYTDEDQQIAYSGDVFFNLTSYIQGFKSQWGDKPSAFVSTSGTSSTPGRNYNSKFPLDRD